MQSISELIADDVEHAAEWRQLKASEWPNDADRNLKASARLERIAADLKNLDGSYWHHRIQAVSAQHCERYCEALAWHIRAVGFSSEAKTGLEFLTELFVNLPAQEKHGIVVPLFPVGRR